LPTAEEVREAYREELEPNQRAVLWSWVGFTVMFAGVRGVTYSIRHGIGPFRDISVRGAHLHHYLWGIALVSGVGAVGLHGDDAIRKHPSVAVAYGSGLALIVDEFADLLNLRDVYWTEAGQLSFRLGIGLAAIGGTGISAAPIARRLFKNRHPA
jgi:hypothetical protein